MGFPDKTPQEAITVYENGGMRNEKGHLVPGHSLGRKPKDEAQRRFKPRCRELMNKYSIEDIKQLIASKEIERIHTYDALILRTIAAAYAKGGQEFRTLLEYTEGKIKEDEGSTTNIYNQTMWIDNYVDPKRG